MSHKIAIFGSGKIGSCIAHLLSLHGDYKTVLVDVNENQAKKISSQFKNCQYIAADFNSKNDLKKAIQDCQYVLSAAPFYCNTLIATVCLEMNVNYLDLTEDVSTTKTVQNLAQGSQVAFIPQCGLAPGFITIAANHLTKEFDTLHEVKMRVGALPQFPHNRLKYNLTWSTEGLINEYCNDCEVIENGELKKVPPLEGLEALAIEGDTYEAFNTSGGLGTLAHSLAGKAKNMNYKSIRYPGHRDILCTLLEDLKFKDHRDDLKKIFERSLPNTEQDVVVIFISVIGEIKGKLSQKSIVKKIYHKNIVGFEWGGIQITTAAGICAVLDMHASGQLQKSGFIRQEDVDYQTFITNRFGQYYN